MAGVHGATGGVACDGIAELAEQVFRVRRAAVDVADDVEGSGLRALVVEQRLDDQLGRVDLVGSAQHVERAGSPPWPAAQRRLRSPRWRLMT